MKSRTILGLIAAVAAFSVTACAGFVRRQQGEAGGAATNPLLLRQVQVVGEGDGGATAVLLRLSRTPDMVRHETKSRPARVVIEAAAANGGEDLPERSIPQAARGLQVVRVARKGGVLRVTLEFSRDEPPPYSVREMADWILIRFDTSSSSG